MKNEAKKDALVSVVIPTHGRLDTLGRAIESAKSQTYKNIEIIVVDDNSDDLKLRERISKLVKGYGDLRLILNREVMGGSNSRNHGIKEAKGEFIAFLDDDDEFLPEKIEKQYALYKKLQGKKVGMIYCYANFIVNNGEKKFVKKVDFEGLPLKEHLISCIAATSWWFCPKAVLLDIGGFTDVSSHQDAMTLYKMMLAGYEVYRVPEVLLNYYLHVGAGITEHSNKWVDVDREYMKQYEKNSKMFSKKDNRQIRYSFYRRMASFDYVLGNGKKLFSETRKMIGLYPFRMDTVKAIAKCCLVVMKGKK